jgi:hypothetical protein
MRADQRATAIVLLGLLIGACDTQNIHVTSAEYGEAWPFTVAAGTLRCDREGRLSGRLLVTLDTGDGIMYGLNGSAQSFGYPSYRSILKPGKTGADVQPFIQRGLTLCKSN